MIFSNVLIKIMVGLSLFMTTAQADVVCAANTQVLVNGTEWYMEKAPVIEKGELFVSIRDIAEALELDIYWDAKEKTMSCIRKNSDLYSDKADGESIKLKVGQKTGWVNGQPIEVPVPAKLIEGKFMMPLSFLDKAFNLNMYWDKEKNKVELEDANQSYEGESDVLVENEIDLNSNGKKETLQISGREYPLLKIMDNEGRLLTKKNIDPGAGEFMDGGISFQKYKNKSYLVIIFRNTEISEMVASYKLEGNKLTETYVGTDHELGPSIESKIDPSNKLLLSYPKLKKKYLLEVGEDENEILEAGDSKGPSYEYSDYDKDGIKELKESWYLRNESNDISIDLYYKMNLKNDKFEVYDFVVKSSYKTKAIK